MQRALAILAGALLAASVPADKDQTPATKGTTMKSFVYKQTPQGELKIYVHFPKGWRATDKRAGMVFFFGGGWVGGSVRQFLPQATYFGSRGLVTARADYRVKSRHGVSPPHCVEDAKSAVRFLRANAARLGIDPGRIVGSGGSAGAHMAACAAMTTGLEAKDEDPKISSKPDLLVLFNPPLKLHGDGRAANRMRHDPEMGRRISPLLHLRKTTPPIIMFYGSADPFYKHDAREFLAKAKKVGAKVSCKVYPRQGHAFFNRQPFCNMTLRADEFLIAHGCLTGRPTVGVSSRPGPATRPAKAKK